MDKNISKLKICSVMVGFFVMGFVDIVGVTTSYVKNDFSYLTDSVVNLISLSCFFWFLVLSIPTGMLMNRIGRKKTVLLSFLTHVVAMILPFVSYNFTSVLVAFALVGIGNTLLQVSLNPLVSDVVATDKLSGTLTIGQFVKAVSSFCGPILVAWGTSTIVGWKVVFPIYALLSLLALVWLWLSPIVESGEQNQEVLFKSTFSLLSDKYILLFFLAILVLVGVDVSINMTFPKLLVERCSLSVSDAGMGNSVYFFARTAGAFIGGILMMKYCEYNFYACSVWLALAGLILMLFANGMWFILISAAIFGLGYANLFSIIFSLSLKRMPQKMNEVSALLIAGLFGGAILPPLVGVVTDMSGSQSAALILLGFVWLYLILIMGKIKQTSKI
ncbi:transporter, major facilitator family protein [Bacteroidales bacterium KA00344]|nr:transporter, major facilitator family protein [Bacteroidales bacterium KA00344]